MFIHDTDERQKFACKIFNIWWILMEAVAIFNAFNDEYIQYPQTVIFMSHNL